jgi:hypothetical protein
VYTGGICVAGRSSVQSTFQHQDHWGIPDICTTIDQASPNLKPSGNVCFMIVCKWGIAMIAL